MTYSIRKLVKKFLFKVPIIGIYLKFRSCKVHNKSIIGFLKFYLKKDKSVYWPRSKNSLIGGRNILVGMNSSIGGNGNYIQGNGLTIIGNYVILSSNIGILSGNHDVYDQSKQIKKKTIIGDHCWIGMNSVILPGVELGMRTIVGAGSVVTKSFPEGFCVIAGNPAKKIKDLDPNKFIPEKWSYNFYGYIPEKKWKKFKQKHLKHLQEFL